MPRFPITDITAFLPKNGLGLRDGIDFWCQLLRRLEPVSKYFFNMTSYNDETGVRTSPLLQFDDFVEIWDDDLSYGDDFTTMVSIAGGNLGTARCGYDWGRDRPMKNDMLDVAVLTELEGAILDANLIRALYRAIILWQRPNFISGGSRKVMLDDSVFSSKMSAGWAVWVPEEITPEDLPMAQSVEPLECGTLIFSSLTPFGAEKEDFGAKIARMQDTELGLNDLLLLPPYDMPDDWTAAHRSVFK